MREIKFRAWDSVQGIMLPVECINFREGTVTLNEGDNSVTDTLEMFQLMQYTGLKDKNGTEIFEGDILKVDDGKYGGVVKFNDHDLSYVIEDKTGGYGFVNGKVYDEWPEYRTYEVIGNIWENKDLLQEDVVMNERS